MQAETRTRICPLCRRPADDGVPLSTRLCRDCRSMIEPILPRAGLVQADYAVTLAASPSLAPTIIAPQPMHEADFDEVSFAPAHGFRADDFSHHPTTQVPAESAQPAFVHDINPLAHETVIAPDQDENDEINIPLAAAPPAPVPTPISFEAPVIAPDLRPNVFAPEPWPVQPAPFDDRAADTAMPSLDHGAAGVEGHTGDTDLRGLIATDAAAAPAAPVADPWQEPLPAWEYSQNEWPMLVDKQKSSGASKLKWVLIGSGVLVIAASLAVYFFVIKPRREQAAAPPTAEATAQKPLTVLPTPPKAADTPPASANATAPANANRQETPASSSVNQTTEPQWKHSLQVMASPNADEANSQAERLKNAGIAAYVVRADRDGRVWYRVRIGRFATPEEAQRFTLEVRARARAAGITLKDLQVTGYDKP